MGNSTTRSTTYMKVSQASEWLRERGVSLGVGVLYAEIRAGRLRAVMRRGMTRGYLLTDAELLRWLREEWEAVPCGE